MKIVLYTNIMTPYRKYFYDLFYEQCKAQGNQFVVLVMAENENNRSWFFKDFDAPYAQLLKGRTISRGETYIHINTDLKKRLQEIRPDIVIASGSYICPGTWTVSSLKKKMSYKVFFWSESHLGEARNYSSFKLQIRNVIRKLFYKRFDGFLCPGKLAFDFVNEYANSNGQRILLPNLVDESIFKENRLGKAGYILNQQDSHKLKLFTPARLSEVKGIIPFMNILSKCTNKDRICWYIAGTGNLEKAIQERAQELKVDVRLLGPKTQDEVADLYQNTDLFVLPSMSDPNPLTCIEAIWSKKPLIVSNHVGNYPEIIHQNVNGVVFSYEDENKAIELVDEILDKNDEWYLEAERESYKIANNIYDSRKTVDRVIKELSQR